MSEMASNLRLLQPYKGQLRMWRYIAIFLCIITSSFVSNAQSSREFPSKLLPVLQGDRWGYVDARGQMSINPLYDAAGVFSEGLAAVQIDGKYGYIDEGGNIVIEPRFEFASEFSESLALVLVGGESKGYGYIDKQGKLVISARFRGADNFHEGLAAVGMNE